MGARSLDIVDEQAVKAGDFHLTDVFHHELHHIKAFRQIEEWMFGRIRRNRHHDFIEHAQAPRNNVGMPMRDGIKRAGVNTDLHGCTVSRTTNVERAVSPYEYRRKNRVGPRCSGSVVFTACSTTSQASSASKRSNSMVANNGSSSWTFA